MDQLKNTAILIFKNCLYMYIYIKIYLRLDISSSLKGFTIYRYTVRSYLLSSCYSGI